MSEIQRAVLLGPGLAAENTTRGNFQFTSSPSQLRPEEGRPHGKMVSCLGSRLSQGRAGLAVPESRPYLQLFLQFWCICLALLWSLQTFLKAWDTPLPFPENSLHVQGPKAQDVRMAAESGWPASLPFHILIGEEVAGAVSCPGPLPWQKGGVLRGNRPVDRSKVVSQPWASVIPGLLCSVFLTFSENFSISVICVLLMNCGQ